MVSIKVKLPNGTIVEYVKPAHCPIPDEEWKHPLGYCWAFATRQDEGESQCTEPKEDCFDI
jgi:hypothetical protein